MVSDHRRERLRTIFLAQRVHDLFQRRVDRSIELTLHTPHLLSIGRQGQQILTEYLVDHRKLVGPLTIPLTRKTPVFAGSGIQGCARHIRHYANRGLRTFTAANREKSRSADHSSRTP
jgi:hypothetical protein